MAGVDRPARDPALVQRNGRPAGAPPVTMRLVNGRDAIARLEPSGYGLDSCLTRAAIDS